MKRFFKKLAWFILPCMAIVGTVIYLDFFKVFFDYDEYYSEDLFVSINREYVCLKTLEEKDKSEKPDSFIFGSSRSQAFKCKDWKKFLPDSSIAFHFDAANEALIGVLSKLEYLEKNKISIDNVLLIVDVGLLNQTSFKKRNTSLTISPPKISSNSEIDFYQPFITASLNPKFVISYIDFKTFRIHRGYMGQYIANTIYANIIDSNDMDIYYGKEIEIFNDSISYYEKTIKSGIFYDRSIKVIDTSDINKNTEEQLKKIEKIFENNKTNYKIVVSPMYDQIGLNKSYLNLLNGIFKNENVYDYSGVNEFTNSLGNFYEKSHYRPHLAREIMHQVYLDL